MLNLSKTFILISLVFVGCGAPAGRMEYLTQSDGRGKVKYETVAELQDTLAAWNYPNARALKMPDSVRAVFPYSFKMYLINEHLDVYHEICETYFPGIRERIDINDQKGFLSPDPYVESLLMQSTTVDERNLLEVIGEQGSKHSVQVIVVMGFYKKMVFDDRMKELNALFNNDLPPVYCVHTLQFADADLSEYEFLSIRYKWFEETGDILPQEAYDRLDSIKSAGTAQVLRQ